MGESSPANRVQLRNMGHVYDISENLGEGKQRTIATLESDVALPVFCTPTPSISMKAGGIWWRNWMPWNTRRWSRHYPDRTNSPCLSPILKYRFWTLSGKSPRGGALAGFGDVKVRSQFVAYKLMHRFKDRMGRWTTEQLTTAEVDCQEQSLTTQAYWLQVPRQTQLQLEQQNLWRDSDNEYGPLWQERRAQVRAERGTFCSHCGKPEAGGLQHDVHHIRPFRTFGYVPGLNRNDILANAL